MKKWFSRPEKILPFFIAALFFKLIFIIWFSGALRKYEPKLVLSGFIFKEKDYLYFFKPVDNYFDKGLYTYDGKQSFAGRMPGYWAPYFALRSVLPQNISLIVIIGGQILLAAFCVYAFAWCAWRVTGNRFIFYAGFILLLLSIQVTSFDFRTLTESYSISAVILFFYFLIKWKDSNKRMHLVMSGLMLTWAFFLRPFVGPALLLPALWFLFSADGKKAMRGKLMQTFVWFYLPFVLLESMWIGRNFLTIGRFIPMETPMHESYGDLYPKGELAFYKLTYAWGENAQGWDVNSPAGWFRNISDTSLNQFVLKPAFFTNVTKYNEDSIRALRNYYIRFRALVDSSDVRALSSGEKEEKAKLDNMIETKSLAYRDDYVSGNPGAYYFASKAKAFQRYVLNSGSGYLTFPSFERLGIPQRILKITTSIWYYFVLILGLAGVLICLRDPRLRSWALMAGGYVFLNIVVIVFFNTSQEGRYFMTALPMLSLCTLFFIQVFFFGNKEKLEGSDN